MAVAVAIVLQLEKKQSEGHVPVVLSREGRQCHYAGQEREWQDEGGRTRHRQMKMPQKFHFVVRPAERHGVDKGHRPIFHFISFLILRSIQRKSLFSSFPLAQNSCSSGSSQTHCYGSRNLSRLVGESVAATRPCPRAAEPEWPPLRLLLARWLIQVA